MYYVRKLKNGKTITWDCSVWVGIALIIIAIVFFVLIYDRFDVGNSGISKIIPILLPYLFILLAGISFIVISLKIRSLIKKGDVFDVYVDPDNLKKYWVDVDFLIEK